MWKRKLQRRFFLKFLLRTERCFTYMYSVLGELGLNKRTKWIDYCEIRKENVNNIYLIDVVFPSLPFSSELTVPSIQLYKCIFYLHFLSSTRYHQTGQDHHYRRQGRNCWAAVPSNRQPSAYHHMAEESSVDCYWRHQVQTEGFRGIGDQLITATRFWNILVHRKEPHWARFSYPHPLCIQWV